MQYDFWGVFGSAEFDSRLKLDVPICVDRLDRPDVPILRSHPIKKGENLTFPIYHINFHAIWLLGGSWVRRVQFSAQIRYTRLCWPSELAGGPNFEVKSNKKRSNVSKPYQVDFFYHLILISLSDRIFPPPLNLLLALPFNPPPIVISFM